MIQTTEKPYLTTGDVARLTGWTIQKVRALCEQGKLPCVNTSTANRTRWTIRRCDLESFLTPTSVAKAQERRAQSRRAIDHAVPKVFG
jgi:hypothetical protein